MMTEQKLSSSDSITKGQHDSDMLWPSDGSMIQGSNRSQVVEAEISWPALY